MVIGGLSVVVGAFISKLKGGNWFAKPQTYQRDYNRWNSGFPSPTFVFFLWPPMLLLAPPFMAFVSLGDLTEGLTNRVHALIERRQDAMAKLAKPNA